MVQKRPFDEDESNEVSFKQQRQHEITSQLTSTLECPCASVVQSLHASGEDGKRSDKIKPEYSGRLDIVNDEHPFHILVSPVYNYNDSERPPRTNVNPEEIYSYLWDHPRKFVPIGPDFQACIPECGAQAREYVQIEKLYESEKFVGQCIIPMPGSNSGHVGLGRTDCLCEDCGSIRCVKQHIHEARDNLKITLGPETFAELGFCDVGEVVVENWSEDEEQLFHEVIFSNPASLGKNFWDHLASSFPSRTKKEIVSYYFNVFMLRRREEQNRVDPMNIDSDNDEWHGSADDDAETDEDDDPMTRSPDRNNGFDINVNVLEKITNGKSDEVVIDHKISMEKSDIHKPWGGQISGHDFIFEGYNAREWDFGYSTLLRKEIDLLPTCSMIEEVFGAGSWNYKARDGQELS